MAVILVGCAHPTPVSSIDADAGREIHVAVDGADENAGTAQAPLRTISRAAELADASDTVVIHGGTYREWVDPRRGGTSEATRITYRAAAGEEVVVLGSEPVTGWQRSETEGPPVWQVQLGPEFFGSFNPLDLGIRHPQHVEADESGDGWGWLRYGREQHRGDVYVDGDSLLEVASVDALTDAGTWTARVDNGTTTLWIHIGDRDPNTSAVEVTTRPHAFFPQQPGLGYITVRGLTFMNVATHWAPPTVPQPGAVGANGGHHWVIEDNTILNSRAVGLSLGVPTGEADLAKAGHHLVRNNVILRCGQSAMTGEAWNSHSVIVGNHVEDINHRRDFGGFETAGIKFHRAEGSVILQNVVRGVYTGDRTLGGARGIWLDYENKNVRVSRNIVAEVDDFAILLEANWSGPFLVDQNITVGGLLGNMSTVADGWVHNLFVDSKGFWLNQTYGDRPLIKDSRWVHNLFVGGSFGRAPEQPTDQESLQQLPEEPTLQFRGNAYVDGAERVPRDAEGTVAEGNLRVTFDAEGVMLTTEAPVDPTGLARPIVDAEGLGLTLTDPEGGPLVVTTDFDGVTREVGGSAVGPFATVPTGERRIHYFGPRYLRARELIGAHRP